ncbi:hypothetical protein [Pseudomonas aeruginosa]|nr:hypothetical protein [Pseudomonas aeruginosa]MBF3053358.1 hypothetical protein [Pseudomonas aeruginosa]MCI0909597.1 hypothetical protein [Pseudomonas aeruginosa]MDC9026860.1 hypothetical protein [Pseudomonas aeruginosa]MDS9784428.1 hypothetical protein [Pseudomonas aeruginosa]HEP9790573.1 hypothetical protein [Pseudomonas aeruginosa]
MDNENETLVAVIVIVLFVLGVFRVVGDMQELYRQTELKGQELSRWSKQ